MEFSKVIFWLVWLTNLEVIAFTEWMMYLTKDLTALYQLIISCAAEVATATGFYFWKARTENRYKVGGRIVSDYANTYGVDFAKEFVNLFMRE